MAKISKNLVKDRLLLFSINNRHKMNLLVGKQIHIVQP